MSIEKVKGIMNHEKDNVATVFGEVNKGDEVEIKDQKGNEMVITVLNDLPFGHKTALKKIKIGEEITKYGEEIGIASKDIEIGEHVHVHNLESIRGRGDWKQGGSK